MDQADIRTSVVVGFVVGRVCRRLVAVISRARNNQVALG
jgi:hypothetical protein